jgi:hypothetical protein
MKRLLFITLTLFGIATADSISELHKGLITKSIFTSSSHNLKTGVYRFNPEYGSKPKLSNANFVGSYFFGKRGDKLRPFIEGGFGFSKIEQDGLTLRASRDSVEFKSSYIQIGGGVNYNINCNFGVLAGGRAIWMDTEAEYKSLSPLSTSLVDSRVKSLLNSDSKSSLSDIYGGGVYHPKIFGYDSEFSALLHHISIDFDHNLGDLNGVYLSTLASIRSKELGRFLNQPFWLKYYIGGDFLEGDLAKYTGFNSAVSFGSSLHWQFAPLIPFLKGNFRDLDLSLNIQGTVSNSDFQGWKVSAGFNLVKF